MSFWATCPCCGGRTYALTAEGDESATIHCRCGKVYKDSTSVGLIVVSDEKPWPDEAKDEQ